ncbi:hypothetical protein [Pleurocapsa sp. FMAR1]|uniref:hypothetical protein n=1 Tax=Pleurocapsa sp. FMAR1 TaxID=3040204 RepID=UPI0029C91E33|nr:hypothetical protein [Pleurocapsa sp. FMAR1]
MPPLPLPLGRESEASRTLAFNSAPLVKDNEPASRLILPPTPTPPASTLLYKPLELPLLSTPSKVTESVALMLISPASPCPRVKELI